MNKQAAPSGEAIDEAVVARLVLANAHEYAIILLDEEGVIRTWSEGAERIFGYTAAEAVGRPVSLIFVVSDIAAGAPELELETARQKGRAEDSRWHLRKNGERLWGNGVAMRLQKDGFQGFLKILRDETLSKLADEQRVLLLNELNHRIKNTLATVQSITEQTLRAGRVGETTRKTLANRLFALSKAHDILVAESWAGASLRDIVEQAIAPHQDGGPDRFELDGPPVRLSPQQAVALSLALHELATNALKYGALSARGGKIAIHWNVAVDGHGARHMNLLWVESGGPVVSKPERTGFGTRLIGKTFGPENGGRARMDYDPEGFRCVLELPLSSSEEFPILDVKHS